MTLRGLRNSRPVKFGGRLLHRFKETRLPLLSAALAYYAVFSLGPLLLLLAAGLSFFLQYRPDLLEQYRDSLATLTSELLPLTEDSGQLVEDSFDALLPFLRDGVLLRGALSLLFLIWSSSNFFASLQLALELIFRSPETRGFWRKRFVAILLVFAIGAVISVEVVGTVIVSYLEQSLRALREALEQVAGTSPPFLAQPSRLTRVVIEGLRALLALVTFTLGFRWLPRRGSSWPGAAIGALFSVTTIIAARYGLQQFFDVNRFNLIYGIITTLVLLLFWLYFVVVLLLCGALIAAEVSASLQVQRHNRHIIGAEQERQTERA